MEFCVMFKWNSCFKSLESTAERHHFDRTDMLIWNSGMIWTHVIEDDDQIGILKVLQLMGDQYPSLVSQVCLDAFFKQMFSDVRVHGWQRIIHQINVSIPVHSPDAMVQNQRKLRIPHVQLHFSRGWENVFCLTYLARLILALWPPLSDIPFSPTRVLSPCRNISKSFCKAQTLTTSLYFTGM
jgi:hypothetical protein